MPSDQVTEHPMVEVIIRAARRRWSGGVLTREPDRRTAESVLLALADAQLEEVASRGFDADAAAALDLLHRHLLGGDASAVTATILRPDHHGGWACRLDAPVSVEVARSLHAIARRFAGDRRLAAIAIETSPWRSSPPPAPPDTSLGDRVILLDRAEGGLDDLRDAARICAALRSAVMKRCPVQPVPEWIGGHREDGEASERDHLAFLALPQPAPDGSWRLGAAAILVPRDVPEDAARRELLPALAPSLGEGSIRLWDAASPPIGWRLRLRQGGAAGEALREAWWRGGDAGASHWASVTPVVMDRHGSRPSERREAIERSCARLGLPPPREVEVGREAFIPGIPPAGSFPMARRQGRRPRQQWHARIAFDRPVRGPIVLGAGRYRGYGLLSPILDAQHEPRRERPSGVPPDAG